MNSSTIKKPQYFEWWPIVLGLTALYIPTYYELATGIWQSLEQLQSPLMFLVAVCGFWSQREIFSSRLRQGTADTAKSLDLYPKLGGLFLLVGLMIYLIGRSQYLLSLEIGSQVLVLTGILLIFFGATTLKALRMPLFFLLVMIPLPGFIVDTITIPMKIAVSHVAGDLLSWFGYPIARAGVVLQIGPYQLLVADACAGLHTLISLEVLGLLYLYLIKKDSLLRNLTLAVLIVPISFIANVFRVVILILVTYHFGDSAGQSFIHQFAGVLLFTVALILIVSMDVLLQATERVWLAFPVGRRV